MLKYLISKIINFFTSDDKLLSIANSLISSIISVDIHENIIQTVIIDKVESLKFINNLRFINFIGTNVSGTKFSIMVCDIGVIHMSITNNIFKNINSRYSVYIKEI